MKKLTFISICERAFGDKGIRVAIELMELPWGKVIDCLVTYGALIGVTLLTRSVGAFLIVIGFGLYNYWKGLTDHDRRAKESPPEVTPPPTAVTKALVQRVKNMEPGAAIRVIVPNECEFIVIEASDFDHICDQAGMVARNKNGEQ